MSVPSPPAKQLSWMPTSKRQKSWRPRFIKEALQAMLDEPCDVPGYTHLTKFQYGLEMVGEKFMDAEPWAVDFVINRLFGKVPLAVEMDVDVSPPAMTNMTNDQLLARLDALRRRLVEQPRPERRLTDAGDRVADAELVPEDNGHD